MSWKSPERPDVTTHMERPVTSRIAPQQARSWLLVPASKPDTFDAALASAADAVILDLEDAVTAPDKPAARRDVAAFLSEHNHAWFGSTTPRHHSGKRIWPYSRASPDSRVSCSQRPKAVSRPTPRPSDFPKAPRFLLSSNLRWDSRLPPRSHALTASSVSHSAAATSGATLGWTTPPRRCRTRVRGSPSPAARHASLRRSTVPRSAPIWICSPETVRSPCHSAWPANSA